MVCNLGDVILHLAEVKAYNFKINFPAVVRKDICHLSRNHY